MIFDPSRIPTREFYRHMVACITPRPIAWVSTVSPRGISNLAPFSFFNGIGANPPAVIFSPLNNRDGGRKDSLVNVEATGEFVLNVVSAKMAEAMNCTSAEFPYEVSEFEKCGVKTAPSVKVKPPRVEGALVHMECVLHQIVAVGDGPLAGNIVIGRVVLIHAADSVLDARGEIDANRLDTIGRMGGAQYTRTRDRFSMDRPSVK